MDGINLQNIEFTSDQWAVMVPIILMSIDIITGFINAWSKRVVKSSVMRQGLAKKFGEITVIAIGQLFVVGIKMPNTIVKVFAIYIMFMELTSICENLKKLGVPIPKLISKILKDGSEKMENADAKEVMENLKSEDSKKDGAE